MSAFLGPIHYWLYNKVKIQQNMVETVLNRAEQEGWDEDLRSRLEATYGTLPTEDLADIIDVSNIHGWLQGQIDLVEKRLAFVVQSLLKDDEIRYTVLLEDMNALGLKQGQDWTYSTPEEAYEAITNTLLDGMPCDRVNQLVDSSEGVCWVRTVDLHQTYWGEDVGRFHGLRDAWTSGYLKGSNMIVEETSPDTFTIRRK